MYILELLCWLGVSVSAYLTVVFCYYLTLINADTTVDFQTNWNLMVSNCYYINLHRCPDQKDSIMHELKRANILSHQYIAVDGDKVSHEYPCSRLSASEIGRKISHMSLLQMTKRRGWTIVLEDDVELHIDDTQIVSSLESVPPTAEIVQFGAYPSSVLYNLLTFQYRSHSNNIWKLGKSCNYIKAYAVRYSAAKKWYKSIQLNFNTENIQSHYNGVNHAYIVHNAIGVLDFFRILAFRNISSIKNKSYFLN